MVNFRIVSFVSVVTSLFIATASCVYAMEEISNEMSASTRCKATTEEKITNICKWGHPLRTKLQLLENSQGMTATQERSKLEGKLSSAIKFLSSLERPALQDAINIRESKLKATQKLRSKTSENLNKYTQTLTELKLTEGKNRKDYIDWAKRRNDLEDLRDNFDDLSSQEIAFISKETFELINLENALKAWYSKEIQYLPKLIEDIRNSQTTHEKTIQELTQEIDLITYVLSVSETEKKDSTG